MSVHYTQKTPLKQPWEELLALLVIIGVVLVGIFAIVFSLSLTGRY